MQVFCQESTLPLTTTPAMAGGDEQYQLLRSSNPGLQLERSRIAHAGQQYQAVQELYWRQSTNKRGAPTPAQSGAATPAENAQDVTMEEEPGTGSLLQSFAIQGDAALEVTVAALGIDPRDHNAVNQWPEQPGAF